MSPYFRNLVERIVATFAFTFLSVFTLTDLSTATEASIAGGAAALTLIKGWLARYVGDPDNAGL